MFQLHCNIASTSKLLHFLHWTYLNKKTCSTLSYELISWMCTGIKSTAPRTTLQIWFVKAHNTIFHDLNCSPSFRTTFQLLISDFLSSYPLTKKGTLSWILIPLFFITIRDDFTHSHAGWVFRNIHVKESNSSR